MARREFSKSVRRDALARSGGKCEAVGPDYGLKAGQRCGAPFVFFAEFDHIIADSIGGEPTLENCAAVCAQCHRIKTRMVDTPRAAKTKRQADKHAGIRKASTMPGSRNSPWKKKFGGGAVRRDEEHDHGRHDR